MSWVFEDASEFPEVPGDEVIPCYTHIVLVEILMPGTNTVMMTHDTEVVADRPLSNAELEAAVLAEIQPWLDVLCRSPKFSQRTGGQCDYRVIGMGVIFGC